jgi:hypothetical protein
VLTILRLVRRSLSPLKYVVGPSGGLAYHLSALRFRRSRWQPFIASVERWLKQDWNPPASELIVFGPSAGWTLPLSFLTGFTRVTAVEPDPLARHLLQRRFAPSLRPTTRLELVADPSLLPWFGARTEAFGEFLAGRPGAAVLFSNVLGQIPLLQTASMQTASMQTASMQTASMQTASMQTASMQTASMQTAPPQTAQAGDLIRTGFIRALEKRSWASYHDLLSGPPCANATPANDGLRLEHGLEALAATCFRPGSQVIDHDTFWLSNERETGLAVWDLRPDTRHLIAFVSDVAATHRTSR